jgi:hypothetical protein
MVRIWEKRLRDGLDLCPIVPLVVYHGESGWTAARSLRELIGGPNELSEYQIDFRFPLMDLSQLTDAEMAGDPILQSTLRLLKYSRSKELASVLPEVMQLIIGCVPANQLPAWIQAIGVYVMTVNKNIGAEEYKQTLKSILPVQFEPGSLADRLLIQGRQEGHEEGLKKGKLTGKIQMLQELLGETPATDAELQSCSLEALKACLAELQQPLRDRQS